MLARERIEALVDPDTPLLELSPLAGWGSEFPIGVGVGQRDRRRRRRRVRDQRHRHDVPRRIDEPALGRQGPALPGDRARQPTCRGSASTNRPAPTCRTRPTSSSGVAPDSRTRPSSRSSVSPRSPSASDRRPQAAPTRPGMSDYTVFVKGRGTAYLGGPPLVKMAIDEVVDEETLGGAEMHSRTSGLSDYLAVDELDGLRIARGIVEHLRWRKLGPGPSRTGRRSALRSGRVARLRLRRRARAVRHPRDLRPVVRRLTLRGVQAAVRRQARVRLGVDPRVPDRRARQQRDPVLGGGPEGGSVHPALQPHRHAARVPPQHHRLHGRLEGRAGRDHPQRRQDDQRRVEQRGAALLPDGRRLVRRRQLRDVGPCLRPALHLLVAEPPHRSDGWSPARGSDGHRRPQRRRPDAAVDVDESALDAQKTALEAQIESESSALFATGRVWDDGIIHPADSRTVLGLALSAAHSNVVRGATEYGVWRH